MFIIYVLDITTILLWKHTTKKTTKNRLDINHKYAIKHSINLKDKDWIYNFSIEV